VLDNHVDGMLAALMTDGVTSLPAAFTREWVERMREDTEIAFDDAISRPGGAVPRIATTSRCTPSSSVVSSTS
jgi:hypothetical protein